MLGKRLGGKDGVCSFGCSAALVFVKSDFWVVWVWIFGVFRCQDRERSVYRNVTLMFFVFMTISIDGNCTASKLIIDKRCVFNFHETSFWHGAYMWS